MMGAEFHKRKQSIAVPREVRAMASKARIPTGALGRLARVIDADEQFRTTIAVGVLPELVDPIGTLWLQRPEGWEGRVMELAAELDAAAADSDLRASVRREEKRRLAAEQTAVRLRADLHDRDATVASLRREIDVLRSEVAKADDEVAAVRSELVDVRNEARHARDREAAAQAKLGRVAGTIDQRDQPAAPPTMGPVDEPAASGPQVDVAEVADVAREVRQLGDRLDALLTAAAPQPSEHLGSPERAGRRTPARLPGGVIASSGAAAEFLLRSDAVVLVDGYNVAKLAWPNRSLEAQRTHLLDAVENLARRFGTDITVVFDGSAVVGAHATRRRLVRVVYSPAGVIADDVIRDEVRRLPTTRNVVVVTNDAEIVADVKALGANVVPSNALIAVA